MILEEFLNTLNERERKKLSNNTEWWKDRQSAQQNKLNEKGIKAAERQLRYYYQDTMFRVMDDFANVYMQLLVDTAEGKPATPATLYRLDSYWKMQAQLAKELEKLGDLQSKLFSQNFIEHYQNAYKSALPAESAFSQISTETAAQMINNIWCNDGKSWSDRVWNNISKLRKELNDGLIDCVVTGKPTSVLKKNLQERFGVSYNRADTIVRTEYTHIQAQAAQQRYKDSGVKEVQVWADPDERTCDICGKMHKKKFDINGQLPIPAHPKCRCRIIPVIETEFE